MLLVGAVPNGNGRDAPDDSIANHDWVVAVLAELLAIRLEPSFGLLCFLGHRVLGFTSLLGCFLREGASFGFSFPL